MNTPNYTIFSVLIKTVGRWCIVWDDWTFLQILLLNNWGRNTRGSRSVRAVSEKYLMLLLLLWRKLVLCNVTFVSGNVDLWCLRFSFQIEVSATVLEISLFNLISCPCIRNHRFFVFKEAFSTSTLIVGHFLSCNQDWRLINSTISARLGGPYYLSRIRDNRFSEYLLTKSEELLVCDAWIVVRFSRRSRWRANLNRRHDVMFSKMRDDQ